MNEASLVFKAVNDIYHDISQHAKCFDSHSRDVISCSVPDKSLVALTLDHLQQRQEHWAVVDLLGKGGHVRTVPVPDWVRTELDDWLAGTAIDRGKLFRRVSKAGTTWGEGLTEKAVWHIVKEAARGVGVPKLAPHDLRRTEWPTIWKRCCRHPSGRRTTYVHT